MPVPELPPPQSSLPEAVTRFGATVLGAVAARAHDTEAVGGPTGGHSLPGPPAGLPFGPPAIAVPPIA
ncbi:2-methylisoborneol synthase, partial [Streptomyces sp. SID7499]|nr:2-methylisoborneol synthase [Streptomyces sp. SID7499]